MGRLGSSNRRAGPLFRPGRGRPGHLARDPGGRDLRPAGPERRREDDDPLDALDAAGLLCSRSRERCGAQLGSTSTTYLADYPEIPLTGGGVATVNGSSGGTSAHLDTLRLAASRGNIGGTFTHTLRLAASRGNIGGTFTQFVTDPETAADGVAALIFTRMQAAPWTLKTGTVIDQLTTTGGQRVFVTLTYNGWAHAPASTTSSTAQLSGVVQLVMPNQVMTNLALGSSDKMASAMVMVLRFVPEPGLLLLLGSGVAGLAALGRRRMRSIGN